MPSRNVVWIGPVLLAAIMAGLPALASGQEGKSGIKIAVVNVRRVFDGYGKPKAITERLAKKYDEMRKATEADFQRLSEAQMTFRSVKQQQVEKDQNAFNEYQQLQRQEWDLKKRDREMFREMEEEKLVEMRIVLADITAAVAAVAKAEGYDLVLRIVNIEEVIAKPQPGTPPAHPRESRGRTGETRKYQRRVRRLQRRRGGENQGLTLPPRRRALWRQERLL
jgi:Skp family chaperone for outer membrane proteins